MRILPLALITVGVIALLRHYGIIDHAFMHLLWPLLLIGIGVALLARGPRWRSDMRDRMQDRWERRMHRHFGPGWANLSEEERGRFRAGMRQWQSHVHRRGGDGDSSASAPAGEASVPTSSGPSPAPGERR